MVRYFLTVLRCIPTSFAIWVLLNPFDFNSLTLCHINTFFGCLFKAFMIFDFFLISKMKAFFIILKWYFSIAKIWHFKVANYKGGSAPAHPTANLDGFAPIEQLLPTSAFHIHPTASANTCLFLIRFLLISMMV